MNAFHVSMAASLTALAMVGAQAQGFQDSDTCYSWNGGNHSSGSFIKCNPPLLAKAKPQPVPAPLAAAPTPAPVMMPMQTCAPEPKATKHIVHKKKPPVKC